MVVDLLDLLFERGAALVGRRLVAVVGERGQTVDVVYSAANPASNARIEIGTGITQFLWVLPVLGALLFFGSLWTFILRAGSIAAGIALVRDGSKRSKMPVA